VVTLVYQLADGALRPYLGAGGSVLYTYDARITNATLTAVNQPELTVSPAVGVVAQGGLDLRLWSSVYARVDVKYIALMTAHAEVRNIQVKTPGLPLFHSVEVGTAKLDVQVNPLIVQGCVGVDF
jgi:outer membrane protein W